ncbi:Hypothetical protein HVIM_04562 (plasmid) [Roseomonas mucosa]|nr:Hypothetical protein HVIM_04562 [Roseomonas mucosa]UZO94864.1 Hypothetical protein RMP42_04562 [Roseomonas mucosa]
MTKPTEPAKAPLSFSSSAQKQNPCSARWAIWRSIQAFALSRSPSGSRCSITAGSADIAAKGSRSSSIQGRRIRRVVSMFMTRLLTEAAWWPSLLSTPSSDCSSRGDRRKRPQAARGEPGTGTSRGQVRRHVQTQGSSRNGPACVETHARAS